ncbi:MAG: hypothetical protein ABEJ65_01645, partial [bacterium]
EPSVPILQVLVGAGMVDSILLFHTPLLVAMGATDKDFYLTITKSMMLVLFFLMAVHVNIVTVALAYVLASLVMLPVAFRFVQDFVGVTPGDYLNSVQPALLGTIGVVSGVSVSMYIPYLEGDVKSLIGGIVLGTTGFFVMTGLFSRENLKEVYELALTFVTSSQSASDYLIPGD